MLRKFDKSWLHPNWKSLVNGGNADCVEIEKSSTLNKSRSYVPTQEPKLVFVRCFVVFTWLLGLWPIAVWLLLSVGLAPFVFRRKKIVLAGENWSALSQYWVPSVQARETDKHHETGIECEDTEAGQMAGANWTAGTLEGDEWMNEFLGCFF